MKNILIAFDSFKGSITSDEANGIVESNCKKINPNLNIQKLILSDGGEGFLETYRSKDSKSIQVQIHNPLDELILGKYLIRNNTAFLSLADTSGLTLIPEDKRNPELTSTRGLGDCVVHSLNRGIRRFVIGIGGSATNDAGMGALSSLGFRFLDRKGSLLPPCGKSLTSIHKIIEPHFPELTESEFLLACDVNNPFYGKKGAAYVYSPQKGADPEMVVQLDRGLRHFHRLVKKTKDLDLQKIPGSGAAGGLAGGLFAYLNSKIIPGMNLLINEMNLEEKFRDLDLILTGEGCLDNQTLNGKTISALAGLAKKYSKPILAFAGSISGNPEQLHALGLTAFFSICRGPSSMEASMQKEIAKKNLELTSFEILKLVL